MQKLLGIFDYLKRYHSDIYDVVCILLEIVILKRTQSQALENLLEKAKKRKNITQDFDALMQKMLGSLYVKPNPSLNLIKALRTIAAAAPTNEQIEILINNITQKKTINRLYLYSTPIEINRLIVQILDIQDGDEIYNPCYGIGSLFLALAHTQKKFKIYGEELDSGLDKIARLILKTLEIPTNNLHINNILKTQVFPKNRRFNKIMCNPPLDSYIGTLDLKNNERFAPYGFITKSAPELSFIINGISYLKDRGVFVIRNQLLKKTSVEERFKEKICADGLLEAIIELPKNIFSHNSADFSLMVISKNNDSVLHIDASSFYQKEGKYNRLVKIDEIVGLLRERKNTAFSHLTPLSKINCDDLRTVSYLNKNSALTSQLTIQKIGATIQRGTRINASKSAKNLAPYFNVGISNFNEYGFVDEKSLIEMQGERDKIAANALREGDILLSLRGITPKLTIISKSSKKLVANAGILVLRATCRLDALGLYCYLFTHSAQKILHALYEKTEKKTIDIDDLYNLALPQDFRDNAEERFEKINALGGEILRLQKEIEAIKAAR